MRASHSYGAGTTTAAPASVPSYASLLAQQRASREPEGVLQVLAGARNGEIAYNPSAPFELQTPSGRVTAMYVRVESQDSQIVSRLLQPPGRYNPRSVLYVRVAHNHWEPADAEALGLPRSAVCLEGVEDPFLTFIGGELILGGVVIDFSTAIAVDTPIAITDPSRFDYSRSTTTVTVMFWRGSSLAELGPFRTIRGMREVRLVELSDGSVLVATRPQGGEAGLGKIGLTRVPSLDHLTQQAVDGARLLDQLVAPDIKVGPNDMYLLPGRMPQDDQVGMLAHTAYREPNGDLHYFAAAFRILNPHKLDAEGVHHTPLRVIATRRDWPAGGKVKRRTLEDVVFPSALTADGDRLLLTAGVSDGEVGTLVVDDPFRS